MKISIIGEFEDKDKFLPMIDNFVSDHKVSTPVILSAGGVELLSCMDKYAKGKGYPSVILGNALILAVLNGDKLIFVWDGEDEKYKEMVSRAKKEHRPYIDIRTK